MPIIKKINEFDIMAPDVRPGFEGVYHLYKSNLDKYVAQADRENAYIMAVRIVRVINQLKYTS